MAEKYAVELALPGNEANNNNNNNENMTFLLAKDAGLIPRSVRLEIAAKGALQDAPSKQLVEQALLLSDISGFTALGEKLTAEHGDAKGAEEFAISQGYKKSC